MKNMMQKRIILLFNFIFTPLIYNNIFSVICKKNFSFIEKNVIILTLTVVRK